MNFLVFVGKITVNLRLELVKIFGNLLHKAAVFGMKLSELKIILTIWTQKEWKCCIFLHVVWRVLGLKVSAGGKKECTSLEQVFLK